MGVILSNPKSTTTASFHFGMLALPGVPSFWFCWATLNLLCEGNTSMWWFFYWNITMSHMLTTTETSNLQKMVKLPSGFFFFFLIYIYKLSKFKGVCVHGDAWIHSLEEYHTVQSHDVTLPHTHLICLWLRE